MFIGFFTYIAMNNKLLESSELYELAILTIFIVKLAMKIQEFLYINVLIADPNENPRILTFIEEFYRFFQEKSFIQKQAFFFEGMLFYHQKNCKFSECALKFAEKSKEFQRLSLETQEILMKRLITEFFLNRIRSKDHIKQKNLEFLEEILMKYISFSSNFNISLLKALFEIQNILKMNKNIRSFYFHHVSTGFMEGIRQELLKEMRDAPIGYNDQKEIPLSSFFKMLREKQLFQNKLSNLLMKKQCFWEKYQEGFMSYESVIKESYKLINETMKYKELLSKNLQNSTTGRETHQNLIFSLKFHSIFSCVIVNNINEGVQLEDKLEKIMKRELTLENNILNCHSFFNDKLVVIQASFLHLDGKIVDSCKTAKLANFFGFSLEELRNIVNIKTFMPKIIADLHGDIIGRFVNENTENSEKKIKNKTLSTFGVDKKGFIFQIKAYIGQNFQKIDDFIFEAAFLNVGFESEMTILIDREGFFQGISKGFMDIFLKNQQETEKKLDVSDIIGILNSFCLFSGLEEIFKENCNENTENAKFKGNIIKNISQNLRIPVFLKEIIEILRLKNKEEQSEASASHHSKGSLAKNQNNETKSSKFLSLFFSTMKNLEGTYRTETQQKFLKKQLSSIDVLKKLLDTQKCMNFRMIFNVNFSRIHVKNKEILLASLTIHKISKIDENFFTNSKVFKSENSQNYDNIFEKSSDFLKEEPELTLPPMNTLSFKPSMTEEEEEKSSYFTKKKQNFEVKKSLLNYNEEYLNNRLFTTEAEEIKTNFLLLRFQERFVIL